MSFFETTAILLTLAAGFGYLNHRWIGLPNTIGIMLLGLLVSVAIIVLGGGNDVVERAARKFVSNIDFNETLMQGMLSYLLFAGALHVNFNDLRKQRFLVAFLATFGVLLSTLLVAGGSWLVFSALGLAVPFIWCLVFGSLISPTDPVAVLGILRAAGVPKSLETKITGESLFNDGVGVVVYLVLLSLAVSGGGGHHGGGEMGVLEVLRLLSWEAGGGVVLGLLTGGIAYFLLRSIDHYSLEVLITLALVTGGYALASELHLSGPLAMVVAGLLIGNHGRDSAMSEVTRRHLDLFWELVDEVLNALLFLLIGLEIFMLDWSGKAMVAGGVLIVLVLAARWVAVSVPVKLLSRIRTFTPGVTRILTWGGLRGGISVALALAIPRVGVPEGVRETLLLVTYLIVIFSIAVQGLTLKRFVAWVLGRTESA